MGKGAGGGEVGRGVAAVCAAAEGWTVSCVIYREDFGEMKREIDDDKVYTYKTQITVGLSALGRVVVAAVVAMLGEIYLAILDVDKSLCLYASRGDGYANSPSQNSKPDIYELRAPGLSKGCRW